MKTNILLCAIFASFLSPVFADSDVDLRLRDYAQRFSLSALTRMKDENPKLTKLGMQLFFDPILSHKKEISCLICHHPRFGTSDGLPVSIGVGGNGVGKFRQQKQAGITARHSPHLFNKGFPEFKNMFWDGRIGFYHAGGLWSPEPKLNGKNPEHPEIASLLTTPLEAQSIFPIADEVEMFGENPHGLDNIQKWAIISKRVFAEEKYRQAFQDIFDVNEESFNIGHIGKALGHFQKISFQVTETRWDKYLRGDDMAMTESQKQGAIVFMTKAKCIACHSGAHLGGVSFQSSAAPQLIRANQPEDDLGRYVISKNETHRYKFLIAPLRNISKTAPYFHNGVFETLEEVVDHYDNPYKSLELFSTKKMMEKYSKNYIESFIEMTNAQKEERLKRLPMFYRHHGPLGLTDLEKTQLLDFLKNGLVEDLLAN